MENNKYVTLEEIITSMHSQDKSHLVQVSRKEIKKVLYAFNKRFIGLEQLAKTLQTNREFKLKLILMDYGMEEVDFINNVTEEEYNKIIDKVIKQLVDYEFIHLTD